MGEAVVAVEGPTKRTVPTKKVEVVVVAVVVKEYIVKSMFGYRNLCVRIRKSIEIVITTRGVVRIGTVLYDKSCNFRKKNVNYSYSIFIFTIMLYKIFEYVLVGR